MQLNAAQMSETKPFVMGIGGSAYFSIVTICCGLFNLLITMKGTFY